MCIFVCLYLCLGIFGEKLYCGFMDICFLSIYAYSNRGWEWEVFTFLWSNMGIRREGRCRKIHHQLDIKESG
jgi:hypothetical protein